MALQLGRSLSELRRMGSYSSPSYEDEEIEEFAGNFLIYLFLKLQQQFLFNYYFFIVFKKFKYYNSFQKMLFLIIF
ncbi:hypothetical protein M5K25_024330 [Dendrobium thyrsiflorum]|uniref:Uncharacterized protein n=1 Tax=Dendrobium thyrsiflorum TaxID=117978 RepID=A0ABD0U1N8_DENTH